MSAALTCSSSFYDKKETFCFSLQDIFFRRGQFVTSHKKLGPSLQGIWNLGLRQEVAGLNNQFKLSLPLNIDNLAFSATGPQKEKRKKKSMVFRLTPALKPLKGQLFYLNAIYNQQSGDRTSVLSPVLSIPADIRNSW